MSASPSPTLVVTRRRDLLLVAKTAGFGLLSAVLSPLLFHFGRFGLEVDRTSIVLGRIWNISLSTLGLFGGALLMAFLAVATVLSCIVGLVRGVDEGTCTGCGKTIVAPRTLSEATCEACGRVHRVEGAGE